jgi:hypothetical protein
MKRKISLASILSFLLLIGIGGVFSYIHTHRLYREHEQLWDYRRLQPDILPSAEALRVLSVWHDTTYAWILWIQLIQFIGDNIGNGRYLEFTHKILQNIQTLHPRFARAYEIDLLFLPTVSPEDETEYGAKKREILRAWLIDYDAKLDKICDMKKVTGIDGMAFGQELWSREDLKNPCLSGYILYYMAARYDTDILDKDKAARYYKIAWMHDDAPSAARFLGILAYSTNGNQRDGALSFALMASEGYDEEPYICQDTALNLVRDLSSDVDWTDAWIGDLEKRATNNPLASAWWTCYESLNRSIKQIYLGYITELTKDIDVDTGKEILELKLLDHIPTVASQSGYTVIKRNNIWRYSEIFADRTGSGEMSQ